MDCILETPVADTAQANLPRRNWLVIIRIFEAFRGNSDASQRCSANASRKALHIFRAFLSASPSHFNLRPCRSFHGISCNRWVGFYCFGNSSDRTTEYTELHGKPYFRVFPCFPWLREINMFSCRIYSAKHRGAALAQPFCRHRSLNRMRSSEFFEELNIFRPMFSGGT